MVSNEEVQKYISTFHGMEMNPIAKPNKRYNENGVLIYAVYILLLERKTGSTGTHITQFDGIVTNIRTRSQSGAIYSGLFDRGHAESLNRDRDSIRTISHDNLTAIAAISKRFNLPWARLIFEHGVRWNWRFDNVNPENPSWKRLMHPRDIIYWSMVGGRGWRKALAYLLSPIFHLTQYLSVSKEKHIRPTLFQKLRAFLFPKNESYQKKLKHKIEGIATSGKQMALVRYSALKDPLSRLVWGYLLKKTNEHGGYDFILESRYSNPVFKDSNPNHPIIHLAKAIKWN